MANQIRLRDTGNIVSERQFRAMHPSTQFPRAIPASTLASFGADPVLEAPRPATDRLTVAYQDGAEQDANGNWVQRWATKSVTEGMTAEELTAFTDRLRDERKAEVAAIRYEHEIGGTTVGGVAVATDRQTQATLIGARIAAKEDAAYTVNWKGPDGSFATLDAATIITVADGVRAHVQACFDNEATLSGQIDAAGTASEISAIDVKTGWPV